MQQNERIREDNHKVFALMSNYLNNAPDYVTCDKIADITEYGVSEEYAFSVILTAAFGLDIADDTEDKELYRNYFEYMFHKLDRNEYYNNPYYKNIRIPTIKAGDCELKYESYKPYEGFVCDDIIQKQDGRQLPQVGFFNEEFQFPAILENNRIWMTITPNEIETMKQPVEEAFGNVLTFGLGLGYYTYMVSEKENVYSVTVVEANKDVIGLFETYILPQFKNRHKVKIIQEDAFEFAEKHMGSEKFDYVFTDLWHDVSDGLGLYERMKKYEKQCPDTDFSYWIEKSILCYL